MPSGKYSNLGRNFQAPATATAVTVATTPKAKARLRTTAWTKPMTPATKARARWSIPGNGRRYTPACSLPCRRVVKIRLDSAGITVIDTTSESSTETDMATAMSRNSWPTSSSITRIGMKTMTVVSAETSTAPQTSLAPKYAASLADLPASRCR